MLPRTPRGASREVQGSERDEFPAAVRRHDYRVDVAGGFPAAQEVYDVVDVYGIRFPAKRRAYVRAPDLKPIRDLLMVAIDFSNFRLTT